MRKRHASYVTFYWCCQLKEDNGSTKTQSFCRQQLFNVSSVDINGGKEDEERGRSSNVVNMFLLYIVFLPVEAYTAYQGHCRL